MAHVCSKQFESLLFAEYSRRGLAISQSPVDFRFRRSDVFIGIKGISLVARRALDAAYFIAVNDRLSGARYEVEVSYFKWLMTYSSNNHEHLKEALVQCQEATINIELGASPGGPSNRHISVPLIEDVEFRGGYITYKINPHLQHYLSHPAKYHFLSLRDVFRSLNAKLLYERFLPLLEQGETPWLSIVEIRQWLQLEDGSYSLFKRLSERVLRPALEHIKQVTGVDAHMQVQKARRGETELFLRFSFRRTASIAQEPELMKVRTGFCASFNEGFGLNNENAKPVPAPSLEQGGDLAMKRMSDIEDGQLTEEKTIRLLRQVEPGISVKEEGTQCDFNNAGLDTRRVKYGSTQVSNAERLCNLESENAKLKRLLAEAHPEIYEFKNVLGV
jgi:hypothetical protein